MSRFHSLMNCPSAKALCKWLSSQLNDEEWEYSPITIALISKNITGEQLIKLVIERSLPLLRPVNKPQPSLDLANELDAFLLASQLGFDPQSECESERVIRVIDLVRKIHWDHWPRPAAPPEVSPRQPTPQQLGAAKRV